jgi:transcriptional regulator with XRE-family HTH domain
MKTVEEKLKEFTSARRKKIAARAAELIAEEMTMRDLRKAHKLTQASIASTLNMTQDGVSRLEKRSDTLISTLSRYVKAVGGNLTLVAEFPNRRPVVISGIGDIEEAHTGNKKRHVVRSTARSNGKTVSRSFALASLKWK